MGLPQNVNLGCDVTDLATLLNRTTFFGGASASATSTGVNVDKYRALCVMTNVTTPSANTVTAAGLFCNWAIDSSADGGTTWVPLTEINGTAFGTQVDVPSVNPARTAYTIPVPAQLVRLRIVSAGAAATGVTATNFWLSKQP